MSTDQNDSVGPAEEDDVEGHVFHRPTATDSDEDVEGHTFHRPTVAGTDDEDDVEGHGWNNLSRL